MDWRKDNYLLTTDASLFDIDTLYHFISDQSYWSRGIPRAIFERSLQHSLCFGLFQEETQIGFARVVSDFATFAYLGDVFVHENHRGRGLSKWMMDCVLLHPDLQGLRRWMLATRDAHELYKQFGFTELKAPVKFMEKHDPEVYAQRDA